MRTTPALAGLLGGLLTASFVSVPLANAHAGPAAPAQAAGSTHHPSAALARRLGADRPADVLVRRNQAGSLRFVGTAPGRSLAPARGVSATTPAATAAQRYVAAHARLFGVNGRGVGLSAGRPVPGLGGTTITRLQQTVHGRPVFGGQVTVETVAGNRVRAVSALTLPAANVPRRPALSRAAALRIAAQTTARSERTSWRELHASRPALDVTSLPLLGVPGTDTAAHLVYRVTVTDRSGGAKPVRELVLVDALTGAPVFTADEVESNAIYDVCNASDKPTVTNPKCPPSGKSNQPRLMSGASIKKDLDASNAKRLAQTTYDFYGTVIGNTSDLGDPSSAGNRLLASTVHICDTQASKTKCERLLNAFWDGHEMVYGDGMSKADDVVAHELTHSVTQHLSNLFYWYQSGAINESLSDTIGELVDQADGSGSDSEADRWLLGEDLPNAVGVLRDMRYPNKVPTVPGLYYGNFIKQPDSMTSGLYWGASKQTQLQSTGQAVPKDMGGVHINSGVGNKAAYLIVDGTGGGTFNNVSVPGLGGALPDPNRTTAIQKAAQIYFHVDQLLPSGAQYADLYNLLPQACDDLIGGTAGITSTDCDTVQAAVDATQMNVPAPSAATMSSPYCGSGNLGSQLWTDDFENATKTNKAWSRSPSGHKGPWYYPPSKNIYNAPMSYASSGSKEAWGDDPDPYAAKKAGVNLPRSGNLTLTHRIAVPSTGKTYVTFDHAFQFEWYQGTSKYKPLYTDGGRVQISANGGKTWVDAQKHFVAGGYNHTITGLSAKGTNVIDTFHGFGGDSLGYGTSQINLTHWQGQRVQIRFQDIADQAVGAYGWFVDDVRFFTC